MKTAILILLLVFVSVIITFKVMAKNKPGDSIEENFAIIEEDLNIILPQSYKDAIRNYPFKNMDDIDNIEDSLIKNKDRVVALNLKLRKDGFGDSQWPKFFFVIGEDGSGNYYFMNLKSKSDERVFYADHESDFEPIKLEDYLYDTNLGAFIKTKLEIQNEIHGTENIQ